MEALFVALPIITIVVTCALTLAFIVAIFLVIFMVRKVLLKRNSYLESEGVEGEAKILDIADTAITLNGRFPVVDLDIEITSLQPHVRTSVRTAISRIKIPRVGDTVQVKYDPKDPTKALVV